MILLAAIPSTQMIFAWTLLAVLCVWTCICAFLALRPQKAGKREVAELPTPSGAIPAIAPGMPLRRATVPVELSFSGVVATSSERAGDIGSPVA